MWLSKSEHRGYPIGLNAREMVRKLFSGTFYDCSLIGRYLMDSKIKFREILRVLRDIFDLIVSEI